MPVANYMRINLRLLPPLVAAPFAALAGRDWIRGIFLRIRWVNVKAVEVWATMHHVSAMLVKLIKRKIPAAI